MLNTIRPVIITMVTAIALLSCAKKATVTTVRSVPLTPAVCAAMQTNNVITPINPIACERLRRVDFQYINFDGAIAAGHVVVLDAVADQVADIFSELFAQRFPLQKAVAMEAYQGNDEAAMRDNNTSAFNGRPITDGAAWSKHAYGVALDINPLQNPYISLTNEGDAKVLPPASAKSFVNRHDVRPGKVKRAGMVESVVEIFARHGFMTWGGEWDFPIDYQHFEIGSRTFVSDLLNQPPDAARQSFNQYARNYRQCVAQSTEQDAIKRRVACVEKTRK